MTLLDARWLASAALLAGALNAVAGGGSFLTLPALLAAGVPPVAANATGTVALLPGYLSASWASRRDLALPRGTSLSRLLTLALVGGGIYAVKKTPLDALPDLSDVQVIVFTQYPGQAPKVVEDQVTYPLTTAMLAVPKAKVVRGFSMFGASYVYVIF